MAMAEELAIVGVIARLFQLEVYGDKVLHRLNDFQPSLEGIPDIFKDVKDKLLILLENLDHTKYVVEKGSIEKETKEALLLIVNGCQTQITLLDNLISSLLPQERGFWRKKANETILRLRQDAEVTKITATLQTH